MTSLTTWKLNTPDLQLLFDKIQKFGLGYDDYFFDRFYNLHETTSNYPIYNYIKLDNVTAKLEIALAGFKKKEVNVYTQDGKLFVEGKKEDKETGTTYVHKGLAQRSFTRVWTISEDTEVRSVDFEDGLLTVVFGRVVPLEKHKRKDWF
jgi:molecular chaperone IbpA